MRLTGVRRVTLAQTSAGEYGLYALTLAEGATGTALISSTTGGIAGASWGKPSTCTGTWALQAGLAVVDRPGESPLFITGRISATVAPSTCITDGQSTPAVTADDYFLAWVEPVSSTAGNETANAPPVTLVARDASGREIGHLDVGPTGAISHGSGQSSQMPSCG